MLSSTASSKTSTKRVRDYQKWLASNDPRKSNSALRQRKHRNKARLISTIQIRSRPFRLVRGFKDTSKECRE